MKDTMGIMETNLDDFQVLTEPYGDAPKYNFKKIKEYCIECNKEPRELTQEEMERFRSN